jgi:hypothetical protein
MTSVEKSPIETDPRFPSGPWTGFFLQREMPGRHMMEVGLTFRNGTIRGEGRDWVGQFSIRGRYDLADGKCYWTKRYLGRHDVFYQGYNEGKGIWGTWEFSEPQHLIAPRGGFHIWPEGMGNPNDSHLKEEVDTPVVVEATLEESVPLGIGI